MKKATEATLSTALRAFRAFVDREGSAFEAALLESRRRSDAGKPGLALHIRARDAEIAMAMGRGFHVEGITLYRSLADRVAWSPPRFHRSFKARAALLAWLAADGDRWARFWNEFSAIGAHATNGYEKMAAYMCATPAQVADAAVKVIRAD